MRELLDALPLEGLLRIDAALEGDWSPTVVTVWRPGGSEADFSGLAREHARHRPSLELYFPNGWVGLYCFRRLGGRNVFDEEKARAIIQEVRARLEDDA